MPTWSLVGWDRYGKQIRASQSVCPSLKRLDKIPNCRLLEGVMQDRLLSLGAVAIVVGAVAVMPETVVVETGSE